jgi:hypothetical protein
LATRTNGFVASGDVDEVRTGLVDAGVPNALATPADLSRAHLVLEGGMRLEGNHIGAAFRYRDGDHVYVLQRFNSLAGGGTPDHSRHVGHSVVRGYTGNGVGAAVWTELGTTQVFTGMGETEAVLDLALKAFWGAEGGGHH